MTARRNVGTGGQSRLTLMVGALTSVFVLSHAFRTTITMASDPLVQELGTSTQVLGAIAGSFHIAFALAQPAVGIALDRYGPRLTILVGFLLTIAGSLVSAAAPNSTVLIAGQWLIGFGCSPALLAVMVFISQRYASERFAVLSGVVLSVGGTGMLMTGTPLAWTIEVGGWRMGFYGLAALSAVSWFSVFVLVDGKSAHKSDTPHQTLGEALRGLGSIFKMPHTYGICCLAATGYAAFLTLRGLWLGPLLVERHDFSLIEIGHVALAMSLAGIVGPLAFGKLDPGDKSRRNLLTVCSAIYTLTFAIHALGPPASLEIAMIVFNGFFRGVSRTPICRCSRGVPHRDARTRNECFHNGNVCRRSSRTMDEWHSRRGSAAAWNGTDPCRPFMRHGLTYRGNACILDVTAPCAIHSRA